MTTTYRDIFEALLVDAETIATSVEFVLGAGIDDWTEADEEDCEVALDRLASAFPRNAHVYRALELAQTDHVADMLDMAVDTSYIARTFDQAYTLDARTVQDAIAEVADAEWRDGEPVSIRDAATDRQVAEAPACRRAPSGTAP